MPRSNDYVSSVNMGRIILFILIIDGTGFGEENGYSYFTRGMYIQEQYFFHIFHSYHTRT